MNRTGLVLVVLTFALLGKYSVIPTNSYADEQDVLRATLENGLRVVIVRNTLAPVVSTAVNYLVGADETPPGFPGMAHAQEHMMFRGSPGISADQLADLGSIMGGQFNADTRQTVTQYFYTVPAENLDIALNIEALRMRQVLNTGIDWEQERGAIEQEVADDFSNPFYVLYTKLRATIFTGTVYAHDGLGTRPSFDATTAAMLKGFHDQWYAPNNAILIIVGDLDPNATLVKVRQLFGTIPAKIIPNRPKVVLNPVTPQSFVVNSDLPYGLQVIALRMPGLDSPDYAAAEVLVDVLRSQRGDLYGLVPQGKALGVDFSYDPLPKSGLAYAVAAFPSDGNAGVLESEMREILVKTAKEGVSPDLVDAAKLQEQRSAEFQKNSIEDLAAVWSEAVAVDGLNAPDDDLTRIEKVTVEDVNRVVRKYFDIDHAVTATLIPQGLGKPISSATFGGQENISLGEVKSTPLPAWAKSAISPLIVPKSTVHPIVSILPDGITLIVQPEDVSDTVSVYGHIKNRPELQTPKGKDGINEVVEGLFSYGSKKLDRIALQQALDAIGANENAGTDFSLQTPAENFDRGVELLADNELHPAFPQKAFDVVKLQVSQTVAGQLTSPNYLSRRALSAALFPKDDPFLREALPQTVDSITSQDISKYYQSVFRPDLTVIVVVGKVTPDLAKAVIEKYFGGWTATGPKPETTLPPVPLSTRTVNVVPDASRVQDSVTLAETLGLTRANPDYYALELGNNVLGGSFYSTRLTRDIRKDAGLVYYVESNLDMGKSRGIYFVEYGCDPQNLSKVNDMIASEIREMQKMPVTVDELQRAKALLLRQIPLDAMSVDSIAQGLIQRWNLDLLLDEPTIAAEHYLNLNVSDVRAAFVKWLRPDDLVRIDQGPSP